MKVSTKFEVDTTIRCLVSVIAADTLRDLVTLTYDLGQWSYMARQVVNPPPSLKILRLSILEL